MRKILINARKKLNKTQKEIAVSIGVCERTYQSMEAGNTIGAIKKWQQLSALTHIPIYNLIQDDTNHYNIIIYKEEDKNV